MKSFFISSAYCTGIGLVEAEVVRTASSVCLVGVAPGDARAGSTPGRREEDEEHEHADREHHEHHRHQAPRDEAEHQRPS